MTSSLTTYSNHLGTWQSRFWGPRTRGADSLGSGKGLIICIFNKCYRCVWSNSLWTKGSEPQETFIKLNPERIMTTHFSLNHHHLQEKWTLFPLISHNSHYFSEVWEFKKHLQNMYPGRDWGRGFLFPLHLPSHEQNIHQWFLYLIGTSSIRQQGPVMIQSPWKTLYMWSHQTLPTICLYLVPIRGWRYN